MIVNGSKRAKWSGLGCAWPSQSRDFLQWTLHLRKKLWAGKGRHAEWHEWADGPLSLVAACIQTGLQNAATRCGLIPASQWWTGMFLQPPGMFGLGSWQ